MDSYRGLTGELAEDLGWLEEHGRRHPELGVVTAELRLAAALVRNCIGPYLDSQPALPLHVAVVGGAGAGKSTVANLLSGTYHAEANPQAGFTRHPIAYASDNGTLAWPAHVGFLGTLQRLHESAPANLDADVYQVERVAANGGHGLLERFVVWDCPDMTTWAASGYVPRMLEVAALADIIVYVASDERYNDEVPTEFLRVLLRTGKPVVACLVKMKAADAPAMIRHFQQDVLSRMPAGVVACLPIPFLSAEELADPIHRAGQYRIPLVNQIAVLGDPPAAARRRTVQWAASYLQAAQDRLLGVAKRDVTALAEWQSTVRQGQMEFDRRYRREYLTSEKFRRFDEALGRLMELLELPGAGRVVSSSLYVVRTPYRLVRGLAAKALQRPEAPSLPEQPVLEQALAGWLDLLRKEAARRAATGAVWAHIDKGFGTGLTQQARERFTEGLGGFRLGLAEEVDRTARAIYEDLEKNPVVLNTLRGGKFTIDMAAIVAAVITVGQHWALDFVLVPAAAAITHQLVEVLGKQYVDGQRELTRSRQQALVTQYLSGPLAEWLIRWPTSGGSAYERLNLALQRVPSAIRQIEAAVTQAPAQAQ